MKNLEKIKSKLANKRQNEDVSNDNVTKKQCVLQKWGAGTSEVTQKK